MISTINLILPVKPIPWAIIHRNVTTAKGIFTLGFDDGYVISNGKRFKIGRTRGYEYIRKTSKGKRKYVSAKALLALYLPHTE